MTARKQFRSDRRPPAIRKVGGPFVELAAITGAAFALRAAGSGGDDTLVAENARTLQTSGTTRLTVPADPDSLGAALDLVSRIRAALARSRDAGPFVAEAHRLVMLLTVDSQRRVANLELTLTGSGAAVGSDRRELPPHRPNDRQLPGPDRR